MLSLGVDFTLGLSIFNCLVDFIVSLKIGFDFGRMTLGVFFKVSAVAFFLNILFQIGVVFLLVISIS